MCVSLQGTPTVLVDEPGDVAGGGHPHRRLVEAAHAVRLARALGVVRHVGRLGYVMCCGCRSVISSFVLSQFI